MKQESKQRTGDGADSQGAAGFVDDEFSIRGNEMVFQARLGMDKPVNKNLIEIASKKLLGQFPAVTSIAAGRNFPNFGSVNELGGEHPAGTEFLDRERNPQPGIAVHFLPQVDERSFLAAVVELAHQGHTNPVDETGKPMLLAAAGRMIDERGDLGQRVEVLDDPLPDFWPLDPYGNVASIVEYRVVDLARSGKARWYRMKGRERPEGLFSDLILKHLIDDLDGFRFLVFVAEACLGQGTESIEQRWRKQVAPDRKKTCGFHKGRTEVFQITGKRSCRRLVRRGSSQGGVFQEKKGDPLVAVKGGGI